MTQIYIAPDHITVVAEYSDPRPHQHLAFHLLIGLHDNVKYVINDVVISCGGIYIASDIQHTVENQNEAMLVFLFDHTTLFAERINQSLHHAPYKLLEENMVAQIRCLYKKYPPKEDYMAFWKRLINIIEIDVNVEANKDERIQTVLDLIENMEEIKEGTIDCLAKSVYLSQSRLSHLFKEQNGISLVSYLTIAKLKKTYQYLYDGVTLTDACLRAGFNSSAHFSATHARMFGLAPSHVLKEAKIYIV